MTQSPAELDVVTAFRRQLAALPEPRRRPRGVRAVAALAAVATLPLVMLFAGGDGATSALAISRDETSLQLRIADPSADPGQMTRELNDAGIRGRVLVVPVAPQHAGTWVVMAEVAGRRRTCIPPHGTPSEPETVRLADIQNAGSVLRIPITRVRESSGSFVLVAGREAAPGERALDPSSPEVVQRDVLAPALGPPPATLRAC